MGEEHKRRVLTRRGVECPRCETLYLIKKFPAVESVAQLQQIACHCLETIRFDPNELEWYEVLEKVQERGFALPGEWQKKES